MYNWTPWFRFRVVQHLHVSRAKLLLLMLSPCSNLSLSPAWNTPPAFLPVDALNWFVCHRPVAVCRLQGAPHSSGLGVGGRGDAFSCWLSRPRLFFWQERFYLSPWHQQPTALPALTGGFNKRLRDEIPQGFVFCLFLFFLLLVLWHIWPSFCWLLPQLVPP